MVLATVVGTMASLALVRGRFRGTSGVDRRTPSGGRAEAATIMNRLYELLHQGTLGVTGHTLVANRP